MRRRDGQVLEPPPWYYKILISSRAATISWWDRRFACHRRLEPAFGCGYAAWYYKILISSRAASISWWHRRFACHRRLEPAFGCGYAALWGGPPGLRGSPWTRSLP